MLDCARVVRVISGPRQEDDMAILTRIWGVVIIVRALLPIALVLAIYSIGTQVLAEARQLMAPSVAEISYRLVNVQLAVAETQEAVGEATSDVTSMVQSVNAINRQLTVDLGSISEAVGISPVTLGKSLGDLFGFVIAPGLLNQTVDLSQTLDILGLGQVKGVFAQTAQLFFDMADLTGVSGVGKDVAGIIAAVKTMSKLLRGLWHKWGPLVSLGGVVSVVWLIVGYLDYLGRSLSRGWRMLRGQSGISA